MTKPPIALHVEVKDAAGVATRWDANDRDPGQRPDGISFGNARMSGFTTASVTLSRNALQEHADLNLLDDIAFIGEDGTIAWEGRITALPRSIQARHQITVQAAGHIAHASDRKFQMVYVDRDIGRFGAMSRARHIALVTGGTYTIVDSAVEPSTSGQALTMKFHLDGKKYVCEAWYDAGPGLKVGRIHFDYDGANLGTVDGGDANWGAYALVSDDDIRTNIWASNNLLQSSTSGSGYHTPDQPQRFAELEFFYSSTTSSSPTAERVFNWKDVAVYGDHDIDPTGTDPDGVTASAVIRHVVANFCPGLDTSGVTDTTYPISHLVFRDRTTPYDAFLRVNAFHLWNLAVWENRTLYFGPVDMSDFTWQARTDQEGVETDLQGDSSEKVINGVTVTYESIETGRTEIITPDSHSELLDSDPENPATKHGLEKYEDVTLSYPALEDDALQMGRALLAEYTSPTAPGSISIRGHVKDRAGHWWPVWMLRSGDTIAVTDHQNDRPRLITDVQYDHGSQTAKVTVEGQPRRLDALFDRLSVALNQQ